MLQYRQRQYLIPQPGAENDVRLTIWQPSSKEAQERTVPHATSNPRKRWYWRLLRASSIALVLITLLVGLSWWRLNVTDTNFSGAHFNQHQNAIWAQHAWVEESHTPQQYNDLAALLKREQIGYLYA